MQLFYHPDIDDHSSSVTFSTEESTHIVKVLRKKEGDVLHITNGKGTFFKVAVTEVHIRKCTAKIIHSTFTVKQEPKLHLAVAPTKMNDRFEWFLEKATEIGVSEITPIICDHSERKVIKMDRMQKVLQSAMKQSVQCYLPKLNEVISLKTWIKNNPSEDQLFIAHCAEEIAKTNLKDSLIPHKNTTILIGPEGDFSRTEIALALKMGYLPISLGENRLRTETAGIFACTAMKIINS